MNQANNQSYDSFDIGYFQSPLGVIEICCSNNYIERVAFLDQPVTIQTKESPLVKSCQRQLDEYFSNKRQQFDLPLALKGTSFQQSVWEILQTIPFGTTSTYGTIAQKLNKPQASRAVGMANHHNPVVIIVPCHRVIGANGKLVGYGGGLMRKEWLLRHEMNARFIHG